MPCSPAAGLSLCWLLEQAGLQQLQKSLGESSRMHYVTNVSLLLVHYKQCMCMLSDPTAGRWLFAGCWGKQGCSSCKSHWVSPAECVMLQTCHFC
jgi:hypothetical protein